MESDEFQTPTPPAVSPRLAVEIHQDEVVAPAVPLKRRLSTDSPLESSPFPSVHHTQRALLARTAPHLFDRNGHGADYHPPAISSASKSSASSPNYPASSSRSPSSSARQSPNPSEEGGGRSDRGTSLGPSSSPGDFKSRHIVPKNYRGPIPHFYDPEDIGPVPPLIPIAGSDLFNTANYPYCRNGYSYIAAGPSTDQLPASVYRTLLTEPRGIHWSWSDRSPFTHISKDASIVSTDRGFRSARANVPVREGQWYVEVHILPSDGASTDSVNQVLKDGPHVRLGWGRREAGINAPVGINGYSYGIRDTTGEKVFLSRMYPYGRSFGEGDVIGMYISLPKARKVNENDPLDPAKITRKRIPIRYKDRLYFETMEYAISKEMEVLMDRSRRGEKLKEGLQCDDSISPSSGLLFQPQIEEMVNVVAKKKRKNAPGPTSSPSSQSDNLRPLPTLGPNSQIGFFINGEPQGIAFDNLLDYRPLRKQRNSAGKMSIVKSKDASSLGLSAGDTEETSIITTNSSLADILKSRENYHDDGSTGYFPFVSLFGGAKVKIVSKAEDFKFPPPVNVRQALEQADRLRGRERADLPGSEAPEVVVDQCRALEERYEEYLAELWKYDLDDEEVAKEKARLLQANAEEEDDDDENAVEQKPLSKASKKSKKKNTPSSRNDSPRTASTPLQDDHPTYTNGMSQMRIEIKQDKMTEVEDDSVDAPIIKQEDAEESIDATMNQAWSEKLEQDDLKPEEHMQVDFDN